MKRKSRKSQHKQQIANTIIAAVQNYKDYMVGKTFMYVFDNRFIEVVYRTKDFAHLTGVDSHLSANDLYRDSIRGKLKSSQFYFSKRHPYDLCLKKIDHIENLSIFTNSELFLLETVLTDTTIFQFGMTDLDFTLCLGKDLDKQGNEKSSFYIAKSLRAEDCFDRATNVYEVRYIFSKSNDERLYNTINYIDDSCNISLLSDFIKEKLSPELYISPSQK